LAQVQYAINNNYIGADTVYFNNTVQTKEEFERNWMIPVKASWLAKKVSLASSC